MLKISAAILNHCPVEKYKHSYRSSSGASYGAASDGYHSMDMDLLEVQGEQHQETKGRQTTDKEYIPRRNVHKQCNQSHLLML